MARRLERATGTQGGPAAGGGAARGADWPLRVMVFVAGFVLMGFEIAASRLLAPYFGNSVYVWGSLIGVVLAALGIGYAWGGRIADRRPSRRLLGLIGLAAAVSLFLVQYATPMICGGIRDKGWDEKERWGPILASGLLFLVPSVLFGMVSPFAVRLQARAVETVGRTAGALYALSTLGSFAGTFATTFVLIPELGVSTILKLLGGAMAVSSALMLAMGLRAALPAACALVAASLGAATPPPPPPTDVVGPNDVLVFEAETPYHQIFVVDGEGVRYLKFNHFTESSIYLRPDYPPHSEYTKYFHVAPAFTPRLRRVCFIGAGGGIGPREFLSEYPGVQVDCVDIDPVVLRVCQDYFSVPRGERALSMIPADGRRFLERPGAAYDAIILDAFTIGGRIPFHLTTLEFFRAARARLAPEGVFLMNVNSALAGPKSGIYRAVHRTLAEAFTEGPAPTGGASPPAEAGTAPRRVFAIDVFAGYPEATTRNVIFVATRATADWAAAVKRAGDLVDANKLRGSVMGYLDRRILDEPDARAPLLTDDYAPIETMPF